MKEGGPAGPPFSVGGGPTGNPAAWRSARLRFEPLRVGHARDLSAALTDPRASRHFAEGGPTTVDEVEAAFARMIAGPSTPWPGERCINVSVRLLDEPRFVGRLEATVQDADAEIAYLFDPAFWGRGYATEAVA